MKPVLPLLMVLAMTASNARALEWKLAAPSPFKRVELPTVVGTIPEKRLAPSAEINSRSIVVTGGGLNNPRPLTDKTWMAPLPAGIN